MNFSKSQLMKTGWSPIIQDTCFKCLNKFDGERALTYLNMYGICQHCDNLNYHKGLLGRDERDKRQERARILSKNISDNYEFFITNYQHYSKEFQRVDELGTKIIKCLWEMYKEESELLKEYIGELEYENKFLTDKLRELKNKTNS